MTSNTLDLRSPKITHRDIRNAQRAAQPNRMNPLDRPPVFAPGWEKRWWRAAMQHKLATGISVTILLAALVLLFLWLLPAKAFSTPTVITQEINLVNCPGSATVAQACTTTSTTDAPTNGALGMTQFDPKLYGGNIEVYFEVVMTSSGGFSVATATLYNQTGTPAAVFGADLYATYPTPEKQISGDIAANLKPGDTYTVRLNNTAGTTTLLAARLIIRQTFGSGLFTQTASSIDIGNNTTTAATTATDITDFKIWKYDASKFDGSTRIYLEATSWTSGAARVSQVRLFDITGNMNVPMTTDAGGSGCTPAANSLCAKGNTPVQLMGEFTAGLADGHEYKLQMLTSAGTGSLGLARIIVQQKPTIDQSSVDETSSNVIDGGTTNDERAQTFVPSSSGYVYGFSAGLGKGGTAHTDLLKLTLRDGLDGNIIGDTFNVSPSSLSSTGTYANDFYFVRPVWLTSGTTYYIQAERTGSLDATNTYKLEAGTTNTYANGSAFLKGSTWGSALTFDNYFSVYRQLPTKFETYQQQVASIQTQATATYTLKNYMDSYDPLNNWVRTTEAYFFESTLKTSAGTGYANLRDITTPADITSSEVSTASTTYVRVRSADISSNMPSTAKDLDTQVKNSATNTTSVSSSRLVIDVSVGPTIAAIAPNKGPLASGTPLTLYGNGFRPGATLTIGGTSATNVYVVNAGQISATAPSGSVGAADVVVTNTDGTTETFGKAYTYATEQFAVTKSNASDFSAGTLSNTETVGVKLDMSNWLWTNWTSSTTGGSLAASTYYYKVTALDAAGNETTASPESAGAVTTGSTSSVSLGWRPVASAVQYKVYRTTTSGTYTTPALLATLTTTQSSSAQGSIAYTDTAASTSSGAPPGSTASVNGIGMGYGTVPSSGAGTVSTGPTLTATAYSGAHSIQRPDGKFLIILGNSTTTTNVYDPVANTMSAGPTLTAAAYGGAHSIQRPDGKFLIILGGITTTTTNVYDPVANTIVAGPTLTAAAYFGAHSIQRPDGKFLIILGNTTTTNVYDPVANTMNAGPTLTVAAYVGAHSIQRPDGKFLIIIGNGTTTTNIYDPVANTIAAGPTLTAAAQIGAHSIQRPDGKFLIILGNYTTTTNVYDPTANTIVAGPTLTAAASYGAHSIQRPDGKFLIILGNSLTTTNVYDPTANTTAAGPTLTAVASYGAYSIQRPDGKFLIILGNSSNTSLYDAGWLTGTTAQNGTQATFTSEALNPTGNSGWNKLSWQQTADNDVNKVEVRTATSSGGLTSATYRTVSNGQDIAPAAGEVWLQYRATFIRTVPNFDNKNSGNFANVRAGESAVHSNRDFAVPNFPSVTATYSKLQVSSIAPNTGTTAGGTPFTITGTGFSGDSTVTVGGASATNIFVVSSTTITGVTPSGTSGARDVVVTNPSISLSATLTGGFTYGTYSQTIKNTTAGYTTAGSSLTNLSTSGIQMDSGVFQWQDWTPSTTGGSMAAATYYYSVTATDPGGGETTRAFETTGVVTTGTTSSVSLKWRPVSGATGYKVYRTTTSGTYGASSLLTTISTANSSTINSAIIYTDTAAATSSGQPPASNTTASEMTLSRGTVPSSGAGTVSTGPTLTAAASSGAHAIQRPDGKFLIILGNYTSTTNVYDPVANTMSAGPTLTAGAYASAHSIQRPDGKFLIIISGNSTATNLYDPVANTMVAGPALTAGASSGAHSIQRPDGKFLIILCGGLPTNVYDPVANTMSAGPTLTVAAGSGAHAIQRPDGKYLIIIGWASTTTNVYDPVANTMSAGPTLTAAAGYGVLSIQRPDGKFLIILGSGTTATSLYDAGWTMGTSAQNGTTGTYVSEDMSTAATWDKIGWVKTIDNAVQSSAGTVDSVEIKTANTQAALTSATYREVINGGAISPGTCEPWIKIRITYTRPQAAWSRGDHPGANVWLGESSTFENRDFDTPTIQSLTISAVTGTGGVTPNTPTVLKQLHSDGATAIPTGAGTSEDKTVFSASLTTSAASDGLALQVEIQPIGTSFTGTPNETGSLVPCSGGTCATGVTGTMNMIDTPAGSYHWQARSGSCAGSPSAWQPYPETPTNGDTPPAALDFQILGADSLMRGGKTFINGVEQAACSTGYCR